MGINRVTIWVMGLLTYLLSPPDPPSGVGLRISVPGCSVEGLGLGV